MSDEFERLLQFFESRGANTDQDTQSVDAVQAALHAEFSPTQAATLYAALLKYDFIVPDVIKTGNISGTGIAIGRNASSFVYQGGDEAELMHALENLRQRISQDEESRQNTRTHEQIATYRHILLKQTAEFPYRSLRVKGQTDLSEIYVPLRVRRRPPSGMRSEPLGAASPFSANQILQASDKHVLILGGPGSGKSTLLRQLASQPLSSWADENSDQYLPIVVPLSRMATAEGDLEERLRSALIGESDRYRQEHLPQGFFSTWPALGNFRWLLMFDALDEVDASSRRAFLEWLSPSLARDQTDRDFRAIITTRRAASDNSELNESVFAAYDLQPFTSAQIHLYAVRWFGDDVDAFLRQAWETRARKLFTIPLLFTIAAYVYHERKRLPAAHTELYTNITSILLQKGEDRGLSKRLTQDVADVAVPTLAHLARELTGHGMEPRREEIEKIVAAYLRDELEFSDTRAGPAARKFLRVMAEQSGILIRSEGHYEFIHPTFREYFAALALLHEWQKEKQANGFSDFVADVWQESQWLEVIRFARTAERFREANHGHPFDRQLEAILNATDNLSMVLDPALESELVQRARYRPPARRDVDRWQRRVRQGEKLAFGAVSLAVLVSVMIRLTKMLTTMLGSTDAMLQALIILFIVLFIPLWLLWAMLGIWRKNILDALDRRIADIESRRQEEETQRAIQATALGAQSSAMLAVAGDPTATETSNTANSQPDNDLGQRRFGDDPESVEELLWFGETDELSEIAIESIVPVGLNEFIDELTWFGETDELASRWQTRAPANPNQVDEDVVRLYAERVEILHALHDFGSDKEVLVWAAFAADRWIDAEQFRASLQRQPSVAEPFAELDARHAVERTLSLCRQLGATETSTAALTKLALSARLVPVRLLALQQLDGYGEVALLHETATRIVRSYLPQGVSRQPPFHTYDELDDHRLYPPSMDDELYFFAGVDPTLDRVIPDALWTPSGLSASPAAPSQTDTRLVAIGAVVQHARKDRPSYEPFGLVRPYSEEKLSAEDSTTVVDILTDPQSSALSLLFRSEPLPGIPSLNQAGHAHGLPDLRFLDEGKIGDKGLCFPTEVCRLLHDLGHTDLAVKLACELALTEVLSQTPTPVLEAAIRQLHRVGRSTLANEIAIAEHPETPHVLSLTSDRISEMRQELDRILEESKYRKFRPTSPEKPPVDTDTDTNTEYDMTKKAALVDLWKLLIELYDDKQTAKRLADQTGLDTDQIGSDGSTTDYWWAILVAAHRQGKVENLVKAVVWEMDVRAPELRQAYETYASASESDESLEAPGTSPPASGPSVTGSGAAAQGDGAVAAGARGVAIGGDVTGSIITTGDDNTINRNVSTGGGAYVDGNVDVSGGDFVGRDKIGGDQITTGDISGTGIAIGRGASASVTEGVASAELIAALAPIFTAIQEAPADKRSQAEAEATALQGELAKGDGAEDTRVAGLITSLVDLVPSAVSAVVSAFGTPLLAGAAGPVTKLVLKGLGIG